MLAVQKSAAGMRAHCFRHCRWVSARWVMSFVGSAVSNYLAVPQARFRTSNLQHCLVKAEIMKSRQYNKDIKL